MIQFFKSDANAIIAVGTPNPLDKSQIDKLIWLFSGSQPLEGKALSSKYIGVRMPLT
jgi:hypothetical protein